MALVIVAVLAGTGACAGGGGDGGAGGTGEQAAGADGGDGGDGEGLGTGADGHPIYASTHPDPAGLEIVEPPEQPGVEILEYELGPIEIAPGQNNIAYSGFDVAKPEVDGYIVSIRPDLVREDGSVPPVDELHLHHGVWANVTATPEERDWGGGQGELILAAGEEKTATILPPGYGYEYQATDTWVINYMIHNLLATPDEVSLTYEIGFIPKTAPEAADIRVAEPLWMDVQKGSIYPVFDVLKGSGTDGEYTYPDDADDPYGLGAIRNEWRAPRDVVLISASGHLHPGGKSVDLWLSRPDEDEKAHVFASDAVYYEPAGAVSWDVSMTVTNEDWRIAVQQGDVLSISTTYDSARASWYESMGLGVVWLVEGDDGGSGVDPFADPADADDPVDPHDTVLTHGHLPENDNHGGDHSDHYVDATELADGPHPDHVTVADFTYAPGDIGGIYDDVPTVKAGDALTFTNQDAPIAPHGVWHTITACEAPCDRSTGVAYPLADAEVPFDSGELGDAGPPTAGRVEWTIPDDLPPGTYTYFCRIHPSMRGAFRVVE